MCGKWIFDGVYQKNPYPQPWGQVLRAGLGSLSSPCSYWASQRGERQLRDGAQPVATCLRWSWAVCAEVGTAQAGGLTSGGNEVS